jgi:sugar lactone lactonase YvrE
MEDAMKIKAFAIISFLLAASAASASVCSDPNSGHPNIVPLGDLKVAGMYEPVGVAVNDDGIVYVTDMVADRLFSFNGAGRALGRKNIEEPLGLALDSTGRLYVGYMGEKNNTEVGGVRVYDAGLSVAGALGGGLGEFLRPTDILVDAGRVYVTDGLAHNVKIYNATTAGRFDPGSFGGFLRPNGIAALGGGGFVVTDRTRFNDSSGSGLGAGAYLLDANGAKISGNLLTYGYADNPGEMVAPGGVMVDGAGRIYITSISRESSLEIFDLGGNYKCEYDITGAIVRPRGMAMGKSGRLYVAVTGNVLVFGVDDYTDMSVSPGLLEFEAQGCGPAPTGQSVYITNNGPGVLNWELTSDSNWLVASAASGDINGVGQVGVDISVDAAGLAPDNYSGVITVAAPGEKATVKVTLSVLPPPVLSVSAGPLGFTVAGTAMPPVETFDVELSGDASGGLGWTAIANVPWLGASPSSGPSNAVSVVGAAIVEDGLAGLSGGEYQGSITVDAGCADGSPAEVPVSLTYIKGGTIKVGTNLAGAFFTISGPAEYTGGGMTYQADAAPEGTYTITFGKVAGFKEPDSYSLPVTNGGVTEFSGEYRDLRERNNILVSLASIGEGALVADEVKIFSGDSTPPGSHLGTLTIKSSTSDEGLSKGTASAAGDVDGDGSADVVVSHDMGVITGYRADGTPLEGFSFRAFPYKAAVDVEVADLDGDGANEIIAGAGKGSKVPAAVRVFKYTGAGVVDTGINFLAYQERTGVDVAAGDVDGDGADEILTVQGDGKKVAVQVRIWKVRTMDGALEAYDAGGFEAGISYRGMSVAAGDLDADAVDEVIVSTVSSKGDAVVAAYRSNGEKAAEFAIAGWRGANVAAADTDFDGRAEIVAGELFSSGIPLVRVYNADGAPKGSFTPFDDAAVEGVNVSMGRVAGK